MASRPAFVRAVQIQKILAARVKRRYAGMQHVPSRQSEDCVKIVGRAERVLSKSYLPLGWETMFHRGGASPDLIEDAGG
jgi:hypothetical protein